MKKKKFFIKNFQKEIILPIARQRVANPNMLLPPYFRQRDKDT
jgi:hypothetical protein